MKKLFVFMAIVISVNASAGFSIGFCNPNSNQVNYGFCEEGRDDRRVDLKNAVTLATVSEVQSATQALDSRVSQKLDQLNSYVEKSKSDIALLKEAVSTEVEIPAEVIKKLKEELKKDILEELNK